MPRVHGVSLSPFVRKVRVALAEKGIDYELVPVVPFGVSDEFRKISPLGKIPVFEEDDGFTVPDSSVIIAYLERTHPEPALYPGDPREMATALFLEELADTKLVETITPVFMERFVAVQMFKREPDEALVRRCLEEQQPPLFDLLEARVGGRAFAVGERLSVADIALAAPFVSLRHAAAELDGSRWPGLASYLEGIWARPSFKALLEEEATSTDH